MNYINKSKKRLVGRNNQQLTNQIIIDYSTIEDISFQIINDQNQIQEITELSGLYFAGSIGIGKQSYELLFLSRNYTVSGNIITFSVDTYTTNYLNYIKKKNTEINIEIGQENLTTKRVILRDYALACPRVYVSGLSPQEIESKNFYTKSEVDELLNTSIPTKTSDLINDAGFITGYVETDPVYKSTSGQFQLKSEAFDGDYNSLTNKPSIPNKTSDLINDSNFISGYTETDPIYTADKPSLALKSELFSGSYNDLTDKPSIPSKTSDLTNDSNFISGYTETDPIYTADKPSLALKSELFSGSYNDLTNKPSIPEKTSDLFNDNDYTAFEVYAKDTPIPGGVYNSNLGGNGIPLEEIVASREHRMRIRTNTLDMAHSDVVIDWGDGYITKVRSWYLEPVDQGIIYNNTQYLKKITSVDDKETDYVFGHTYDADGKYIIKVYGRDYYSICTPSNNQNEEAKYNLICRVFDNDLPIASNVTNISSFCAYAKHLLSVHVPSYFDFSRVTNIGGIFRGCRNLQIVKGMKNQFLVVNNANQIFSDCYSLTTCDFTLPASVTRGGMAQVFQNCLKLSTPIQNLLPAGGFLGGSLNVNYLFNECRVLSGTVPADLLWNNTDVIWSNTSTAFGNCPAAIRSQVPVSWGGTASDDIISGYVVKSINGKSGNVELTLSGLTNDAGFITGYVETDPVYKSTSGQFQLKSEAFDGNYNSLTNKPSIPSKTSDLTNDAGFITGYVETDPVFQSLSGDFELKSDTITKQGNTFNTSGCLVQLDENGKIPSGLYDAGGGGGSSDPMYNKPLTFISTADGASIYLYKYGTPPDLTCYFNLNDTGWQEYTIGTVKYIPKGDFIRFWCTTSTFSTSTSNYYKFLSNSEYNYFNVDGDVTSLINYGELTNYCFVYLFSNLKAMKTPPLLPSMKLATGCYYAMFYNSGIQSLPELPAITLADSCYRQMFENCQYLYSYMKTFVLPARNPVNDCYYRMFAGSQVKDVYINFDSIVGDNGMYEMFSGASGTGKVYCRIADSSTMSNWVYDGEPCLILYGAKGNITRGNSSVSNWGPVISQSQFNGGTKAYDGLVLYKQTFNSSHYLIPSNNYAWYLTVTSGTFTLNAVHEVASFVCYADLIIDLSEGASITEGERVSIQTPLTAGKRNFCKVKWMNSVAYIFVEATMDLPA